jgi:hypothetical protein
MDKIHIFIASCYEGLHVQVPRLIKNIQDVKIPVEYVHFIVGGCPDEKNYYENGIEIINVKYRCFEFTPLIYLVNNSDKYNFDFAFFTHDTVIFGNNFYNIINNDIQYLRTTNYETMRIDNVKPSMNIGIYSKNIILNNKVKLLELSSSSNDKDELFKLKNKLMYCEDFILKQNNYNNGDFAENIHKEFTGINGTKYNGLLKNFKRIDLIKYQTNFSFIQSIDVCMIK